jgi:hypothetical protein
MKPIVLELVRLPDEGLVGFNGTDAVVGHIGTLLLARAKRPCCFGKLRIIVNERLGLN